MKIMTISPSQPSGRTWRTYGETSGRLFEHGRLRSSFVVPFVRTAADRADLAGIATAVPATKRHPGTPVWSPPT